MRRQSITSFCEHCARPFHPLPCSKARFCGLPCYKAAEKAASLADLIRRFWSHVDKDGPVPSHMAHLGNCWAYRGDAQKAGSYGRVLLNGKRIYAHRFSYELHFGPLPDGLLTCHHCDYRPCVRPDHLFAGTDGDNMRDMWAKGRGYTGRGERRTSP